MPETDFVQITLARPARAFAVEEPTHLKDYAPNTVKVGVGGCLAIRRSPDGGFDVRGPNGQAYWVPDSNVVWGIRV